MINLYDVIFCQKAFHIESTAGARVVMQLKRGKCSNEPPAFNFFKAEMLMQSLHICTVFAPH